MSPLTWFVVLGWTVIDTLCTVALIASYRRLIGHQRALIELLKSQVEHRGLAIRSILGDMEQLIDRSLLDEYEAVDARMRIAICDEMIRKQDAGEWDEMEVPS